MATNSRYTYNFNQDRREIDFHNEIILLEPNKNPLTVMLAKMGKGSATDTEFGWFEDELGARWDDFDGAEANVATTTLNVTTGAIFQPRDVIKNTRTGEVMLVSSIATNALTVIRGYGSTAAAAILDEDPIVVLGNANQEFATRPEIKDRADVTIKNNMQIFRTPFGVSGSMAATDTLTGKDLPYLRRKKAIEHAVDIERAFLFGERNNGSLAPRVRTTRGILSFATENPGTFSTVADVTFAKLGRWFENVFRYGSSEKVLVASARWVTLIDQLGEGKLQTVPKDETYGIAVNRLLTSHGELYVIKHHLLEGPYANTAVALDMEALRYRYLQGRDTKLRTNIQANDADGIIDEYLTECGLEFRQAKRHGVARITTLS